MSNFPTHTNSVKEKRLQLEIALPVEGKYSTKLNLHFQEMQKLVEDILEERKLFDLDQDSLKIALEKLPPIVQYSRCIQIPGGITFTLLCKTQNREDLFQFFCDMIHRFLLPGSTTKILSAKHMVFKVMQNLQTQFLIAEVFTLLDQDHKFFSLQQTVESLCSEIMRGVASIAYARSILSTKSLFCDHNSSLIQNRISDIFSHNFRMISSDIFYEMHHFLVATHEDFKRIRTVEHMCRIISYHHWFRKRFEQEEILENTRKIFVKLLKTTLSFQFGQKQVLGIVICVNFLREYEQFESRHILSACKHFIGHLTQVPLSYFSYKHPSDPVHCLYIEIEKEDGSEFSKIEMSILKQCLQSEFHLCIEQLSNKLFMPENEEEIIRNTLLLSSQIRFVRDPPQMMIAFHSQSEDTLRFQAIYVQLSTLKEQLILEEKFKSAKYVTYIPGLKQIVGLVRNKYPKEAFTFFLECKKSPFLRHDHSIDLARAREFIAETIRQTLGNVRDFNGGLILQQKHLLSEIVSLLNEEEKKQEVQVENLFYSITPMIMRSFLAPETIKKHFELYITLRKEYESSHRGFGFLENHDEKHHLLMIRAENITLYEELKTTLRECKIFDHEKAFTFIQNDQIYYYGCITSSTPEKTDLFTSLFIRKVHEYERLCKNTSSLRISLPRPTSILDPRVSVDRTSGIVIKMLYEGLMRIDTTGKPSPAIAERVEISQDLKTYTFYLRHALWSDGTKVTAHDFEYAWKKTLDPDFKTNFAYFFYSIKNARLIKHGMLPQELLGVRVIDDQILEVELEHPAPYFLELTAHWTYSPLCKHIDMKYPGWAYYGDDTFVSNGPFQLSRFRKNTDIQAIKNTLYWDQKEVSLEQIDIAIIENSERALCLYQNDELDWIGEPLSEIPPLVFKEPEFQDQIKTQQVSCVQWFALNTKAIPLSSKYCRKAMGIVLNRKLIIDKLMQGEEDPAYSILPPGISRCESKTFADNDILLAKDLFAHGLQELNMSIKDVPTLTITSFNQKLMNSVAQECANQWQRAFDIRVKIEILKWDQYIDKCCKHNFQIMASIWYSWFFDPLYTLEHLNGPSHDLNSTAWHNEEFIQLLSSAQHCPDPIKRDDLLRKAEALAIEEMPIIPVSYYKFKYMKKDHVKNIFISQLGQIDFKWARLEHP